LKPELLEVFHFLKLQPEVVWHVYVVISRYCYRFTILISKKKCGPTTVNDETAYQPLLWEDVVVFGESVADY
jgi:hypothetical protein